MKKALIYTGITILTLILIAIIVAIVYFNAMTRETELDLKRLEHIRTSIFLSNEDTVINEDNYVVYEDIPQNLINSFVSIEDKRYFEHNGIDIKRIIGASIYNITHGMKSQGASTITQQLVKNTHLSSQKTIERKLKEVKLAYKLEKMLSKEEIMEKYLNSLYFGNGIYGVKDAARRFFDKNLNELNIKECACLAGIIKAPTKLSPLNDINKCKERLNIVLGTMLENGYIDENCYNDAINAELVINNKLIQSNYADFYIKQALAEASSILNLSQSEIVNGNYRIATYYNEDMQNKLINSIMASSEIIDNHNITSIISDNATSSIEALYTNINENLFDYRRQVGSIMKPIAVYLPAFEEGLISPASIFSDTKRNFGDYYPSNYNEHYRGNISIRKAVMHSSNIVPIDVLDRLSIEKSKEYLSKMNINIDDNGLSIALGGLKTGLTPIEIISAYNTIANSGKYRRNTLIRSISDDNGNVLYRRNNDLTQVFSDSTAYLMTDILKDTAKHGTARKLASLPFDVASKTGTVADPNNADKNIDAYNLSFTSKNTILVWFGGELPANIQGGANPTMLARNIYENIYQNKMIAPFIMPDCVEKVYFDKYSYDNNGEILLTENIDNAYAELFDKRYLPKDKIITPNDIDITYKDDILSINNVKNATIKIYYIDIFGNTNLKEEIYLADNTENIPLKDNIFTSYHIEIYSNEKLLKAFNL